MRKVYLLFPLMMALILAGCLSQEQATPKATSTAPADAKPTPSVVLTFPTQAAVVPASGCTVIGQKPTPGATPQSVFPPIAETDWIKGLASARVTIIEYGDFQ